MPVPESLTSSTTSSRGGAPGAITRSSRRTRVRTPSSPPSGMRVGGVENQVGRAFRGSRFRPRAPAAGRPARLVITSITMPRSCGMSRQRERVELEHLLDERAQL